VTVSPSTASLLVKQTQQFQDTVQGTGSYSDTVNWLVNGAQGGNDTVGTVTSTGLYTAPQTVPNSNPLTVEAQSVQDSTKSGTASVTIKPENVQISVSPISASVQLNLTQQFTASVTGTVNTAVSWSVNNVQGGQSTIGLIDQTGLYTAPANLPVSNTVTVTATSQEDSTKSASATIKILATAGGITVTISPQNPSVPFDGLQSIQFTATVTGTSNTTVSWGVDNSVAQITSAGLFTPDTFNCSNAPPSTVVRAVSAANQGAQAVTTVSLVPPTPTITGLSPLPAAAGTPLQISGTFDPGAELTVFYPGPNGTTIPVLWQSQITSAYSKNVPLGASSGPLSIQQVCESVGNGFEWAPQQSNSVQFLRLPSLRIRADQQVLSTGESVQMKAAFLGDPTPQPITWSATSGTVTSGGLYTAGSSGWDKVTGCITGTQQCDFFVFSIVPARISPAVPVVPTGGTLQLSEVQGTTTLSPTWMIEAGGGTISGTGLYTAPTTIPASGAIPVTATPAGVTNAIGVTGAFAGMVNRLSDYPDISATATGQTTIPKSIVADGNRVYVLSDNLPSNVTNGHYAWIDTYDASDPAHPVWTGAVEGLDEDLGWAAFSVNANGTPPVQMFASSGFLWHVTSNAVAFYDALSGQPSLQQYISLGPVTMGAFSFSQGLLIEIPSSCTSGIVPPCQSPVTAPVFDGRTGTLMQSQVSLPLASPSSPTSINAIAINSTRLFMLFQQEQTNGSLPWFLSTYDLTANPPNLLQTVPLPSGVSGGGLKVFGNLLFVGSYLVGSGASGGEFDISSGLPVFLTLVSTTLPDDMSGPLGLLPSSLSFGRLLMDYSNPATPTTTSLVFNGDDLGAMGLARFVQKNPYVISSGVQIFDVSAPGGQIPEARLLGGGGAVFYDMVVGSSYLYAAEEATTSSGFVTIYDLSQTPPLKISSFALSNEVPLSLALDGSLLFVGTSTELLVLNISNPAAPAKVTSLALPTSSIALVGNTLYAGTTDNRLLVIDVTNPSSPVTGTGATLAGFPVTMQTNGSLLLIAADTAGLLTYGLSNPSAPTLLSQFQPSSAVEGASIDGNLALLAAADGGFVVADITNPAAPVLGGQFPLAPLTCFSDLPPAEDNYPLGLVSVSLSNGIVYLGASGLYGEVFGFDYTTPSRPRLVSVADYGNAIEEAVYSLSSFQSNLFVGGDMFYDRVYQAGITQPRNFIRHMCPPPPFGSNAVAPFPEARTRPLGPSLWNFKARFRSPLKGQDITSASHSARHGHSR
jgi:hypothetical protein